MKKLRIKAKIHHALLLYRKSNWWRKKVIDKYLSEQTVAKLQIGAGPYLLKGWLNTDFMTTLRDGTPMYMDAGKPFPIPDASFDYVFSEHLFEHLTYPQATNMLKECYRIMKPGGVIRIATPNLQFLVDMYLHPEKSINKAYVEFNAQRSDLPSDPVYTISYFHTSWGHQIIYDPDSLTHFLEQIGFKDICRCEVSKSEHKALTGVEQHFNYLQYEFNLLETMVLEARR